MEDEQAKQHRRQQVVQGLREFADFLEAHPDAPFSRNWLIEYVPTREDLIKAARIMGSFDKKPDTDYFGVNRNFGPITYRVYTERTKVCERVVIGTRTVPAQAERTEDIVEWKCASLLDGE